MNCNSKANRIRKRSIPREIKLENAKLSKEAEADLNLRIKILNPILSRERLSKRMILICTEFEAKSKLTIPTETITQDMLKMASFMGEASLIQQKAEVFKANIEKEKRMGMGETQMKTETKCQDCIMRIKEMEKAKMNILMAKCMKGTTLTIYDQASENINLKMEASMKDNGE